MKLWRYGIAFERLGQRYRLERPLGSGGMADVCLAVDEQDDALREVAIKVIKSDNLDQRALDRFLKETSQIVRLDHPHILRVYSHLNLELVDSAHGSIVPYIVMECAQGGDLQRRLPTGEPYHFEAALAIFAQIGSAVQYAHEQGVIHRDIKPHNILFRTLPTGGEQAVLSDFGLAVEMSATHHTFASGGTLAYMAPEQFRGQAQAASDTFALAVVLYQLLTGILPFRRSLSDLVTIDTPPRPVAPSRLNPAVPPALDDVIYTALASDPADRQASAGLFVELVQRAAASNNDTTRHARTRLIASDPIAVPVSVPKWLTASGSPRQHNGGTTRPMPASPFDVSNEPVTDPTNAPIVAQSNIIQLPPDTMHRSHRSNTMHRSQPTSSTMHHSHPATPAPATRKLPPQTGTSVTGHRISISGHPVTVPVTGVGKRRPRRITPRRAAIALVLSALLIGLAYLVGARLIAPASTTTHLTLTPSSTRISASYPVSATTGSPDPAHHELQAQTLSATTQSPSQPAQATGKGQTPGTRSIGKLTFSNGSFTPYTINNTIAITGNSGVTVYLDANLTIPAADANTGTFGIATASAHAASIGGAGNIVALDISRYCCAAAQYIYVKNTAAFTGGQDAATYSVVQQSDITGVSDAVTPGLVTKAQGTLRGQVQAGQSIAGEPTCTPRTQADHQVGDRATTVMVTVTVSCVQLVYDSAPLPQLLTPALTQQARIRLGANFASYRLVDPQGRNTTQASIVHITVKSADPVTGGIELEVQASATWVYHFSDQQLRQLKALAAHRSPAEVRARLKGQPGVMSVEISPDNGNALGGEDQIEIVVATA